MLKKITVLGFICVSVGSCFPVVQQLRLSLADTVTSYSNFEPEGPGTYAFGYDIDDPESANTQFREEERHLDGSVVGKYGWVADDGRVYVVSYVADTNGYRATVKDASRYRRAKGPIQRTIPHRAGPKHLI
ncbi:adult-specific rigid cuticular protein 15.7-like [Anthonomus grandis grandis]|uniref:adult-specific rigid cuticular protein 15.7-like n=1 Tax=Anthonomus grandis grandis TaxID=2921223 RepID=UPI002166095F|nr:adult-specific rigid cuticular protein 15.7-like [Anthonomus grandis grandis]